jgi:hypothetical protein
MELYRYFSIRLYGVVINEAQQQLKSINRRTLYSLGLGFQPQKLGKCEQECIVTTHRACLAFLTGPQSSATLLVLAATPRV